MNPLWRYSSSWQKSGYAVSPHLPLHNDIPTLNVQRFLSNLLPEGNGLNELLDDFHLSRSNTFGLMWALGVDIPRSLIIVSPEQLFPPKASFRGITDDELEWRLNTRDELSLIVWDGKPRLSVAGVQDKINLIVDGTGQFGFDEGSLCSTHILKFENQKISYLVFNEYLTMRLAKRCGLAVADVKLMNYVKHPALLVEHCLAGLALGRTYVSALVMLRCLAFHQDLKFW